jgi:hypothetical protein
MLLFARFGFSQTLFSIDPGLLQQDAQAIDLSDKISFAILAISFVATHCCCGWLFSWLKLTFLLCVLITRESIDWSHPSHIP